MYVSLEFHVVPRVSVLKVPESAVRPGDVLWLVRDGKLFRQTVKVARVVNGLALIPAASSGLKVGDLVVTSPLATELSGQPVRLHGEVKEATTTTETKPEQTFATGQSSEQS
jgi:hypothetical protein